MGRFEVPFGTSRRPHYILGIVIFPARLLARCSLRRRLTHNQDRPSRHGQSLDPSLRILCLVCRPYFHPFLVTAESTCACTIYSEQAVDVKHRENSRASFAMRPTAAASAWHEIHY